MGCHICRPSHLHALPGEVGDDGVQQRGGEEREAGRGGGHLHPQVPGGAALRALPLCAGQVRAGTGVRRKPGWKAKLRPPAVLLQADQSCGKPQAPLGGSGSKRLLRSQLSRPLSGRDSEQAHGRLGGSAVLCHGDSGARGLAGKSLCPFWAAEVQQKHI